VLDASRGDAAVGLSPKLPAMPSTPFSRLDSPLPKSRTGRGLLPLEELYVRKKFPRYIVSATNTGVLLPLEDGLRRMICTSSETPFHKECCGLARKVTTVSNV
jgi:hypothetical protein